LGNPKFKLRTKVHGGNASKIAGQMIRDTDVKNRGHQLRWYKMYKEFKELKHQYGDKQREVTTEKPETKHNNNTKIEK
jgi:hypothetical protein